MQGSVSQFYTCAVQNISSKLRSMHMSSAPITWLTAAKLPGCSGQQACHSLNDRHACSDL